MPNNGIFIKKGLLCRPAPCNDTSPTILNFCGQLGENPMALPPDQNGAGRGETLAKAQRLIDHSL